MGRSDLLAGVMMFYRTALSDGESVLRLPASAPGTGFG